ncbi:MAG: DUF2029 domain-containing protein [Xanthomonadales bacterium]|nr:DUF2029 domain-containing protein [Xanthomonadales bacterium]
MNGIGQSFKNPLSLILAALTTLALLGAWQFSKESPGVDYYVAWVAADAVNNDTPHKIYDSSSRYILAVLYRNKADAQKDAPRQKQMAAYRTELHMTATPFLYWITGLLTTGDYERDLTLWHLLSLVFVTISILVMCRLLKYSPATSLAILLPILVWFAPLQSDLRVGNVNSFQLGLIGLIFWLQSRQANRGYLFATGLAIGLLVMFKPNLGPVALMFAGGWLVRGQFMQLGVSLAGMVTGALTAVLTSSIWVGSATVWPDWLKFIQLVVGHSFGQKSGNYASVSQISSSISPLVSSSISPLGQLSTAIILSLLCLACFWWGRRRVNASASELDDKNRLFVENSLLIATGCIITMLASTLVWLHYYLLIIPMLIVALRPWQEAGPMKFVPLMMLRVLPVVAMVILMETALPVIFGSDAKSFRSVATTVSVVTLLVVGLWQFAYGITGQVDPELDEAPAAH